MKYQIKLKMGKVIDCQADMLEETDKMFILSTTSEGEKKTKAVYMKHKTESCVAVGDVVPVQEDEPVVADTIEETEENADVAPL